METLHLFLLDNTVTLSFPVIHFSFVCKFLAVFITAYQKKGQTVV